MKLKKLEKGKIKILVSTSIPYLVKMHGSWKNVYQYVMNRNGWYLPRNKRFLVKVEEESIKYAKLIIFSENNEETHSTIEFQTIV